ncbi:hypothetical protein [Mesorhizobium sp. M1252]|uniref:hypothetical protein n=1 Tax=Mesorhizobium sp. M1252 TaxID=2957073 RepID=UPI003336B606
MNVPTYVCQRLNAYTERGHNWLLAVEYADGKRTLLGFHRTRKACKTVASFMAGWRCKIEVREKPMRLDAWRVD